MSKVVEFGGTSSLFSGYTILAKSMMGSGLLGVAAACSKSGWVIGCMLALLIPLMTFLSLRLLASVALRHPDIGPLTFFNLCSAVSGSVMAWFVEISLILKTFGAAIVYLQVAGNMLSNLMFSPDMSVSKPTLCRLIQVGIALVFSPFCFLKQLNNTRYVNALGIACLIFIVITACIYFDPPSDSGSSSLTPDSFLGLVSKIPIFVFAYCCHQNVFAIVTETKNPSIARMDVIMALACLTGFLVYVPVQIFPYWTFGSSVKDNFLNNLPSSDGVVKTAFVCAAVSVSISFPLQIIPLRNSVCALIDRGSKSGIQRPILMRYAVAGIAILASLSIALAVSSLGVVMAATGLIGGNTICFLAPSLLYLRSHSRDHWLWYLAAALCFVSLALYPLCLVGIVLTA
jgi:amino acid permease